jgi:hypothetical protein
MTDLPLSIVEVEESGEFQTQKSQSKCSLHTLHSVSLDG